ncbi:MAG: 2-oxo acid dehydrogenase subunit E2 [Verrucomicrobia bacterium]|nr:2-oxo acid dehydrogenase subunit E2 [Verrucomicrobiota bacterium]MBU1735186.1 2-oxo acid dehydrogenase subunit E2 [Verrucomicrobiota bacterium]MBU1855969.1 2-oxo acid dehydrogenase subunit E2 [Verrucomicrobiota bacterium]
MVQTVIMPKLGQTVEESTILKWHKREGEPVKKGEILFEIETDKAVLEIESFFEGTLLKIVVAEGQTVPVSVPVAFIGQPGDKIPEVKPVKRVAPAADTTPAHVAVPPAPALRSALAKEGPSSHLRPSGFGGQAVVSPPPPVRKAISPRARRLIRECVISADPIPGTGPGGRVVEKDVQAYLEAKNYAELKITPAAKNLARANGIDILAVPRVASQARITVATIQQAIAEKPVTMSKMRQVIAQRLTASFTTTPHFYVTVAVDMTDLLEWRKILKNENKPFTVTDFILKAVALALVEFPALNSSTDGRATRWHSRVHLGMAVSIAEGLVVPVIRNAHELSIAELHELAAGLALKARDGKLTPDEMTGSTFTVSNMGMLDVDNFTAIINPGESAILAVASTRPTPVVRDGKIEIRAIMKITLASDHRLVDGACAARFVNRIKSMLEDLELWKSMI